MMPSIARILRPAIAVAALTLSLSISGIAGHGAVDQTLQGDPECTAQGLPSFVSAMYELRQEFMPGSSPLAGVDVCIGIEAGLAVDVNIRSGTAENPGDVIASGSRVYSGPSDLTWVHVNLDLPVTLTPGTVYVLELPDTAQFGWWGSCGTVIFEDCPTPGPDLYEPGVSNSDYVGDFGFRTYTSEVTALQWGDIDCTGGRPTSVDALKVLRHVAALPVSQTEPCPQMETAVELTGIGQVTWGDIDCAAGVGAVDALKILRFVAGLPASVEAPCPVLGNEAVPEAQPSS